VVGLVGSDRSEEQHQGVASTTTLKIKTRRIKEFVTDNLPEKSVLRDLLLEEKDEMDGIEFLAKMDLWMKLLKIESAR
jgi:hypothetical protein